MRLALDDDDRSIEGVPVIDAACFILPTTSIDPWSSLCVRLCRPMDPPASAPPLPPPLLSGETPDSWPYSSSPALMDALLPMLPMDDMLPKPPIVSLIESVLLTRGICIFPLPALPGVDGTTGGSFRAAAAAFSAASAAAAGTPLHTSTK